MYHPTISSPVARRVWGSPDCVLLLFAGSSAEFAAIKAVDWLFFTGRLPDDPIGRFFGTVGFARKIFFGGPAEATAAIEAIRRAHGRVEAARGTPIPGWAYRDVLFMLIDQGERAHEVVFGPMTDAERRSHFAGALAMGRAMDLEGLPTNYPDYAAQRRRQLREDFARTPLTDELQRRYRRAIGPWRFALLRAVQASMLPDELRSVLGLRPDPVIDAMLKRYRFLPGGGDKLAPLHTPLLPPGFAERLKRSAVSR